MHPTATPTSRREVVPLATRPDPRAARILARSLFRDMTENGLTNEQILAVSSELIALVTNQLKELSEDMKGTA